MTRFGITIPLPTRSFLNFKTLTESASFGKKFCFTQSYAGNRTGASGSYQAERAGTEATPVNNASAASVPERTQSGTPIPL